ncbi:MAG: hypothetical protein COT00_00995, partial [Candidatus Omnitrophica bacterium CG07_land_8_20_14_0_80_50_8]
MQLPFALLLSENKAVRILRSGSVWQLFKDGLTTPVREFAGNRQLLWVTLFMVLGLFSPSYGTAFFFRMRDVLHFDPQFLGLLGSVGSAGEVIGCLIFAKFLSQVPIKRLLYISVFMWAVNTAAVLAIVNGVTALAV